MGYSSLFDDFLMSITFAIGIFSVVLIVVLGFTSVAESRELRKQLIEAGYMSFDEKTGELVINPRERVCKNDN